MLCSSDEEYTELGPEFANLTKGAFIPVIAGNPIELIEDLQEKGIKHFIHVRTNILKTLKEFQKELGIEL